MVAVMPAPPWKIEVGLEPVIERWVASGAVRSCITLDHEVAPRAGRWEPAPSDLHPGLAKALAAQHYYVMGTKTPAPTPSC